MTDTSVTLNQEHGQKEWTFDNVFDESCDSKRVYDEIVQPIVTQSIQGYNGTVFAYGQTGSGKTFTMRGNRENRGIIPQAIEGLFLLMDQNPDREFMMAMIYVEIYNEKINNLIGDKSDDEKRIAVTEIDGSFEIQGVEQKVVNSAEGILALLEKGDQARVVARTNMNEHSSRSHAIFRLTVESREKGMGKKTSVRKSQINLVDLAGSEKAAQTGASGQTLKEGCNINKSLFMLGRVINELTSGSSHISYRDSTLTRILQPALGGNAKTAIIATATRANITETKSTLLFAHGAKMIKNATRMNEWESKDALIYRYEKEINELRERVKSERGSEPQDEFQSEKQIELEERISRLQKMVINNGNRTTASKKTEPNRRATVCPGAISVPLNIKRSDWNTPNGSSLVFKKPETPKDEWLDDDDALELLEQEAELRKIKPLETIENISLNKRQRNSNSNSPLKAGYIIYTVDSVIYQSES